MLLAIVSLKSGEVVSFGDIAAAAGKPEAPRSAGRFLARSMEQLPWWRVVYADGRLPSCNMPRQRLLLESEDVQVEGNRVKSSPLGRFHKAALGEPIHRSS